MSVGCWRFSLVLVLCVHAGGCAKNRATTPAATQPVTAIDPAQATPEYWLRQPATVHALSTDFAMLWDAAEETALDHNFTIDRRDQRFGLLTTHPVISKQWFEIWREDAGTADDVFANSLGTIRRTIRFEFNDDDGRYSVWPKVLVERYSVVDPKYRMEQSEAPAYYWYAIGRDTALERRLAQRIQRRIGRDSTASAR